VDEATANKLLLRPPGALKEEDFLKTCIKCGMCVEACPFDTSSLQAQETINLWELLILYLEIFLVICVKISLVFQFVLVEHLISQSKYK
jgi:ferredoxin